MKQNSTVPAFLTKLWTLVEDSDTNEFICWSQEGNSFLVLDEQRFAKEILPKFFKHNNMASFIRQLNMYGFRKVMHIDSGIVKQERDGPVEFQHPYFKHGQDDLLENIKRKVSNARPEDNKIRQEDLTKILVSVQSVHSKQENIDARLVTLKRQNEALWREISDLRQKHAHQQQLIKKLIHFIITLVQSNRILNLKRKRPILMNGNGKKPKYIHEIYDDQVCVEPTSVGNLNGVKSSETSDDVVICDVMESHSDAMAEITEESPRAFESGDVEIVEVELDSCSMLPADTEVRSACTDGSTQTQVEVADGGRQTQAEVAGGGRQTQAEVAGGGRQTQAEVADGGRQTQAEVAGGGRQTQAEVAGGGRQTQAEVAGGGRQTQAEVADGGRQTQAEVADGGRQTQAEVAGGGRQTQAEVADGGRQTQAKVAGGGRQTQAEVAGGGSRSSSSLTSSSLQLNKPLGLSLEDPVKMMDSILNENGAISQNINLLGKLELMDYLDSIDCSLEDFQAMLYEKQFGIDFDALEESVSSKDSGSQANRGRTEADNTDKQLIQYTCCPLLAILDGCTPPLELDFGSAGSTSTDSPCRLASCSVEPEPPSDLLDSSLESKQPARSSLIRLEPLTEAEASEETLFYLCELSPAGAESDATQLS